MPIPGMASSALRDDVGRASSGSDGETSTRMLATWRMGLLALGILSSLVVLARVFVQGVSPVNLDSLLADPLSFHGLVTLPSILALACFALALLPRIVVINLAALIIFLGAAELAAWA